MTTFLLGLTTSIRIKPFHVMDRCSAGAALMIKRGVSTTGSANHSQAFCLRHLALVKQDHDNSNTSINNSFRCSRNNNTTLSILQLLLYRHWLSYPTPGRENQWISTVAQSDLDTTYPNLHIEYHTIICISITQGVYINGIHDISGDSRFLLLPNVNCMQRLYYHYPFSLIE